MASVKQNLFYLRPVELRLCIWDYIFPEALSFQVALWPTDLRLVEIFMDSPFYQAEGLLNKYILTLTAVSHQIRVETVSHLGSRLSLNFHDDIEALSMLCLSPATELLAYAEIFHIDTVEGSDANSTIPSLPAFLSSLLPNLELLHITLLPSISDIDDDHGADHRFGPQVTCFLETLSEMEATIRLSLKWKDDCDYFEKKYMGRQGWKCVDESGEYSGRGEWKSDDEVVAIRRGGGWERVDGLGFIPM